MTLPRTVADVLADHVVFEVECIDRMYCNVYVPKLQFAAGLLGYVQRRLGLPIASTAPLGKITDGFSAAMRRFARDQQVPWVDFVKGQRKDDVAHEHLAEFTGTEGGAVIRDNLDAGRPDQVSLIFNRRLIYGWRRSTPGRLRARIITEGVTPSLHIDYKHTAIKQYHKEGRALRTETTINNTRDFGIGKRLINLPALREIGFSANRRLLGVQRLSHNPIRAAEAFTAVHHPIITSNGHRIAGLRLGDRRAHALLQALLVFRLIPNGFLNRDLRGLLAGLLGTHPHEISASQVSYDLRRLRAHGLITRIPNPTATGSPTPGCTTPC